MNLLVWTDGGSRGNPGEGAVGVVIKLKVKSEKLKVEEKTLESFGERIGRVTNNEAEYMAVIEALKKVTSYKLQVTKVDFFMDSKLICEQLKGNWKIKQEHLKALFSQVKTLGMSLGVPISYTYVHRAENKEADKLVNQAFDAS
ncbi:ribonuclease HI family protein [Candidatus Roizmanbacteria bacterium]|nr:ribonuclease HI family protein [Candidatus Roizmanbacteria bacterium]